MSVTKGHVYLKQWEELEETRPVSRRARKRRRQRKERDVQNDSSAKMKHIKVRGGHDSTEAVHGVFDTPEQCEAFRKKARLKKLIDCRQINDFLLLDWPRLYLL